MDITWLGHASFLIKTSNGKKILMDPFDNTVGYDIYRGTVSIVTISHNHFDHNYIKDITYDNLIDKSGSFQIEDINIQGIQTFHDKMKGAKRGENIVFILEIDGLRVCHLGDLGHLLSDRELDLLGSIDVLFIPVGGNFTIDGEEAAKICKKLQSKIVIPMHYATPKLKFSLEGVEKFLNFMKNATKINSNSFTVEDKLLNETNKVVIMNC